MGTIPNYGGSRHAMTEWKARLPPMLHDRVVQCDGCGATHIEGRLCEYCDRGRSSVPEVKRK